MKELGLDMYNFLYIKAQKAGRLMKESDWEDILFVAYIAFAVVVSCGLILSLFFVEPNVKSKVQHSNNQAALVLLNHFLLHR